MYAPYPYPDEALESVIARYQRHMALSDKEIQRRFGANHLGGYSYLDNLANMLACAFAQEKLVDEHTMSPVLNNLSDKTYPAFAYRYCPDCLKEQEEQNGEKYWKREWLSCGVCRCKKHGKPLMLATFKGKGFFSHAGTFVVPDDIDEDRSRPVVCSNEAARLSDRLTDLLPLPQPSDEVTPYQWRSFWLQKLGQAGYTKKILSCYKDA